MKKIIIKLIGFNVCLALVDIVLLAGFQIWSLKPSEPVQMAATLSILFVTVLLFGYVNYSIMTPKTKEEIIEEKESKKTAYKVSDTKDYQKYIEELRKSPDNCMMRRELYQGIDQMESFLRKVDSLNDLMEVHKNQSGYLQTIQNVIDEMDLSIRNNILKVLKRLAVNDEAEYMQLKSHPSNTEIYQQKMKLFEDNINYVRSKINNNDRMLLEFDKLLNEISRMNDNDEDMDVNMISDITESMKNLAENKDSSMDELMKQYGGN